MILKELYKLYNLLSERGVTLPRMGWSMQKVSFRVMITRQGEFVECQDARRDVPQSGKKKSKLIAHEMLVPGEGKPSGSGVNPCFLCDNAAYLLGCKEVKDRAPEYFAELKRRHLAMEKGVCSEAFSAVCRFLESWVPSERSDKMPAKDLHTGNGVFRIVGETTDVHEDPLIARWWDEHGSNAWNTFAKKDTSSMGMCLITGKNAEVALLHNPPIKGVANAQTSGAKLVSFNCDSFESYGKEQSSNSPVAAHVAFAYCNALNYLLSSSSNRLRVGDSTAVFWTDAPAESAEEQELCAHYALNPEEPDAQDANLIKRVRDILAALASGKKSSVVMPGCDDIRFYILALSPNAARLSVRFFHESDFGCFMQNIAAHYQALKLITRHENFKDPELISPYRILRETARESKDIPPLYAGTLMRSILQRLPYPTSIAVAILRRIRIDHKVNYIRCAFLKAWLTRKFPNISITPMLDETNTHPGYLLGRIFAILQKTQSDALPNINRTIQDAYYATASSAPRSVFPRILKLYRHHLAKLNPGLRVNREKLLQQVMAGIGEFPAHLNLAEQSFFALGFYHQTQVFFTPSDSQQ